MISNFNEKPKNDDVKFVTMVLAGFLLIVWLCTPPGNKLVQMCFYGNNTKMFIAKLQHKDTTEYMFHRNNAVYLAKLYPKDSKRALMEMDKAIKTLPQYVSDSELKTLYKERAELNLYYGNYKQSLSDYVKSDMINSDDYLKMALLYKEAGNYREALSYCNAILNQDEKDYSGYACISDLYDSVGRTELAIKVWDLAIDRKKNFPRAYASRALLKQKLGDSQGYDDDIKKAKEYANNIDIKRSIIDDTLHPRDLLLSAR